MGGVGFLFFLGARGVSDDRGKESGSENDRGIESLFEQLSLSSLSQLSRSFSLFWASPFPILFLFRSRRARESRRDLMPKQERGGRVEEKRRRKKKERDGKNHQNSPVTAVPVANFFLILASSFSTRVCSASLLVAARMSEMKT